ncbi:dihydrofolate reductase family protein [Rhodococcus coprophilus]|uniref:DNA-binding protein n=1 Tax=Rhodococcus coprophilus TaxID=38310 RepID=A0A2X4ULE3_9NOCA|nr:dihydrofolate reductase family protein [Rhodococcus coprophilus]MBM7460364.1 dihydrofolate reductase [Rhodococcus coprophilus]SQI39531.1 DNA-binding protein [Rhodococcus coprophilus]
MAKVIIHATVSLDGFMADVDGGVDWMNGFTVTPEDEAVAGRVMSELGAVVGGANRTQTIDDGEVPYGGMAGVPVYLMTHSSHDPIEKDGVTYTFVVDDIGQAVESAEKAAGDKWVSVLGGSISRQCLELGLVDEIQLHVVPIILGQGVSLFTGLSKPIRLERVGTSAFASEAHLRYRVLT